MRRQSNPGNGYGYVCAMDRHGQLASRRHACGVAASLSSHCAEAVCADKAIQGSEINSLVERINRTLKEECRFYFSNITVVRQCARQSIAF